MTFSGGRGTVALSRVRGLKPLLLVLIVSWTRRTLTSAWIETRQHVTE